MTARRFTDKPNLHPEAVKGLPLHHDAVVQRRTLFPSTVIEVAEDANAMKVLGAAAKVKTAEDYEEFADG